MMFHLRSRALLLTASIAASVSTFAAAANSAVDLKDKKNALSYSVGYQMGSSFADHHLDMNIPAFTEGLTAGITKSTPAMTSVEMIQTIRDFQRDQIQKMQNQMAAAAEENSKKGSDFLVKNKTQPGVVALKDGLQYKIISKGDGKGKSPSAKDNVTVDYEGRLLDGTVFDSSYKRGKSATFNLSAVIPGWTEGLQKIQPGDTAEFYIPAALAYGQQGQPPFIPPNSTLVFKVHLISVGDKG